MFEYGFKRFSYVHGEGQPLGLSLTFCNLDLRPWPIWMLTFSVLSYVLDPKLVDWTELVLDLALLTFICLFMVMQKSVMKYMTRIGQKTGMLKNSKKVQKKAITVALVAEYQNLNSGNRLKRIKQIQ